MQGPTLDAAAHIVQLALTPIFLLASLAQMLNVFMARLGRVADRVYRLAHDPKASRVELRRLKLRSRILDGAVLFTVLAGVLTCGAALTMFLGALRNHWAASLLFSLFGAAIACSVLALVAVGIETILSGRTIRETAEDAVGELDK